jgi:hypothetical protein
MAAEVRKTVVCDMSVAVSEASSRPTWPCEAAPSALLGLTFGLVVLVLGGFAAPAAIGFAADHVGLTVAPLVAGCASVAGGLLAPLLTETAPRLAKAPAALPELTPT